MDEGAQVKHKPPYIRKPIGSFFPQSNCSILNDESFVASFPIVWR